MAKKPKTITVNQLHKMTGRLIENGEGKTPVCVNKSTFHDNRESDGCCILPVDGVRVECVLQADDDGGIKTNQDGSESYRRTAVLFGNSGCGFSGVLSIENVERYIAGLKFAEGTPDIHVTLVAGNIRGFAKHLREMTQFDDHVEDWWK